MRAKDAVEGAGKALCVGGADVEGVEAFIVVGGENGPLNRGWCCYLLDER